jgi:hypothetical protein
MITDGCFVVYRSSTSCARHCHYISNSPSCTARLTLRLLLLGVVVFAVDPPPAVVVATGAGDPSIVVVAAGAGAWDPVFAGAPAAFAALVAPAPDAQVALLPFLVAVTVPGVPAPPVVAFGSFGSGERGVLEPPASAVVAAIAVGPLVVVAPVFVVAGAPGFVLPWRLRERRGLFFQGDCRCCQRCS